MPLNIGADAVNGDRLDYDVYNKGKNHWRAAGAPAGVVAGMLMSRTSSDKVFHQGAAVEEEVAAVLHAFARPNPTGICRHSSNGAVSQAQPWSTPSSCESLWPRSSPAWSPR